MDDSSIFISALKNHDLNALHKIPKTDLHNHFVLGGDRAYIKEKTKFDIISIKQPIQSMEEMRSWSGKNIGTRFDNKEMRKLLIDATFMQAKYVCIYFIFS